MLQLIRSMAIELLPELKPLLCPSRRNRLSKLVVSAALSAGFLTGREDQS